MRDARGRFTKGLKPHNKGRKINEYIPSEKIENIKKTQFKKGNVSHNAQPLGTISRRLNKGKPEWIINIDWRGNRKSNNNYKWYLWEVHHQQDRPDGMVLAIKNGNPDDIRLENLELISRAENLRRNH